MTTGYAWVDIVGAAGFWGSVAQILGISAAWFAFVTERREARRRTFESVKDIITGLEAEMALISLWASGKPDNPGYRPIAAEEYWKDERTRAEWSDPERIIYPFDYPTVKSLTQSQHVRLLGPIIGEFVRLNYSIVRMFDFYAEYRRYVIARPALVDTVGPKLGKDGAEFSEEEKLFLASVFSYNYRIHVQYIGGKDSEDPTCLYHAFRSAEGSLADFKKRLRQERAPRWHSVGHVVAGAGLLVATLLLYLWLV